MRAFINPSHPECWYFKSVSYLHYNSPCWPNSLNSASRKVDKLRISSHTSTESWQRQDLRSRLKCREFENLPLVEGVEWPQEITARHGRNSTCSPRAHVSSFSITTSLTRSPCHNSGYVASAQKHGRHLVWGPRAIWRGDRQFSTLLLEFRGVCSDNKASVFIRKIINKRLIILYWMFQLTCVNQSISTLCPERYFPLVSYLFIY